MKKVWIVVIVVVILGLIGGGVWYLINRDDTSVNDNMQDVKKEITKSDVRSIKIIPSVTGMSDFEAFDITDEIETSAIIEMFNGMKKSDEYVGTSAFLSVNIVLNNGDYYDIYELDFQNNLVTVGLTKADGEYSQGIYISKDFSEYLNGLKEKLRK